MHSEVLVLLAGRVCAVAATECIATIVVASVEGGIIALAIIIFLWYRLRSVRFLSKNDEQRRRTRTNNEPSVEHRAEDPIVASTVIFRGCNKIDPSHPPNYPVHLPSVHQARGAANYVPPSSYTFQEPIRLSPRNNPLNPGAGIGQIGIGHLSPPSRETEQPRSQENFEPFRARMNPTTSETRRPTAAPNSNDEEIPQSSEQYELQSDTRSHFNRMRELFERQRVSPRNETEEIGANEESRPLPSPVPPPNPPMHFNSRNTPGEEESAGPSNHAEQTGVEEVNDNEEEWDSTVLEGTMADQLVDDDF